MKYEQDYIILNPHDIDLSYSPIGKSIKLETYVMGAFNPSLERLENGNLVMMVRIAEALKNPVIDGNYCSFRYVSENKYVLEKFDDNLIDKNDPRKFLINNDSGNKVYGLTSLSWILPIELSSNASEIVKIHYDKIISPTENYQEYGIEDPRVSRIGDKFVMTVCTVSSERHGTTLYTSDDGLNYNLKGIIFDHQNKDVVIFPEKVGGSYYALTRPLGEHYFVCPKGSKFFSGPSINIAESPDLLHWKPLEKTFIRMKKDNRFSRKIGAGAPPIKTEYGWLILFHSVDSNGNVGVYRTFHAYSQIEKPYNLMSLSENEILTENPELTEELKAHKYIDKVVFTSGIVDNGEEYIVASGEDDLCCRITHIPKETFSFQRSE